MKDFFRFYKSEFSLFVVITWTPKRKYTLSFWVILCFALFSLCFFSSLFTFYSVLLCFALLYFCYALSGYQILIKVKSWQHFAPNIWCPQATQNGEIGIALNTVWHYPYSESYADRLAAARATAFTFDYFLEPIVYGRYPIEMVSHVKDGRLPTFTPEESEMLKGSYDFIGINYYSSFYAKDAPCATENITMSTDSCVSIVGPWTLWFFLNL